MPGDVIEVEPAAAGDNLTWVGGDSDCNHEPDQVACHAVCRHCSATTVEKLDMPDSLLKDDPYRHQRSVERV